jgi:hypothetical protein
MIVMSGTDFANLMGKIAVFLNLNVLVEGCSSR